MIVHIPTTASIKIVEKRMATLPYEYKKIHKC